MRKVLNYISDFYNLKSNDIIVASFPKSGNTRIRLAIAKYFQIKNKLTNEFNYQFTNQILPEIGKGNIKTSRKILSNYVNDVSPVLFVKSHLPYSVLRFFLKGNSILYIDRLDCETLMSFYDYSIARKIISSDVSFSQFLRSKSGVKGFSSYLKSWDSVKKVEISYDDLITNDISTILLSLNKVGFVYDEVLMTQAIVETRRNKTSKISNVLDANSNYNFAMKRDRSISKYFSNLEDINFYNDNISSTGLKKITN